MDVYNFVTNRCQDDSDIATGKVVDPHRGGATTKARVAIVDSRSRNGQIILHLPGFWIVMNGNAAKIDIVWILLQLCVYV